MVHTVLRNILQGNRSKIHTHTASRWCKFQKQIGL